MCALSDQIGNGQLASGRRRSPSYLSHPITPLDNPLALPDAHALVPAQIAAAGDSAAKRFLKFFTANIRPEQPRLGGAAPPCGSGWIWRAMSSRRRTGR
jgi:hypothetical protein